MNRAELVGGARLAGVLAVLPLGWIRATAESARAITCEPHFTSALDQLSDNGHQDGFRKPAPVDEPDATRMDDRLERRFPAHRVLFDDHRGVREPGDHLTG